MMGTDQILVEQTDDVLIVSLAGRLDITNSEEFENSVLEAMEKKKTPVIVRLQDVSYMSSSGVRALLSIYHALRKHGKELIIAELSPAVKKIISVTELDRVFPVLGSLENALQKVRAE
ncbi:MAG TPA: anti-sigma factor antagonist [Leptospiraceae bacterium]|nr:anti-anti-sigma factor [Spirochaetaceae bacterium]HBS06407.1 anti-sigma factor antagonist [Leptospiraceae bacterium]|tara:strand:+ start:12581 stop:12934 length:354 start_codon:yes stop_codon:yes gene_type:complete